MNSNFVSNDEQTINTKKNSLMKSTYSNVILFIFLFVNLNKNSEKR